MVQANCTICGNESGYDEETLEASTYEINGIKVILCCPCEDDLFLNLNYIRFDKDTKTGLLKSNVDEVVKNLKFNLSEIEDRLNDEE